MAEVLNFQCTTHLTGVGSLSYLHYMAISRIVKFEIPKYLENLIGIVIDKFNESGISTVDIGTVFM